MLMGMPEEPGDLIGGRYLLAEPTGRSGLGRLWRGHDQLLDREVSVTEISLPPGPGNDRASMVDDIMRRVRAAAQLGAGGGITVHDVAEHAGALWVVTQPGHGESLDAEITRTGQLSRRPDPASPPPPAATTGAGPAPSGTVPPGHDGQPPAAARIPRTAPPVAGPEDSGGGRLATASRANAGLIVGVVTGIVMILALILVVVLFPSHRHPTPPPGHPTVSPASPATP
jgi:hypothetical protein